MSVLEIGFQGPIPEVGQPLVIEIGYTGADSRSVLEIGFQGPIPATGQPLVIEIGYTGADASSVTIAARTGGARAHVDLHHVVPNVVPMQVAARTGGASAHVDLHHVVPMQVAARTGGASAHVDLHHLVPMQVAARTGGAKAYCALAYDPNLLSAVHSLMGSSWGEGRPLRATVTAPTQHAQTMGHLSDMRWNPGPLLSASNAVAWREATALRGGSGDRWQQAAHIDAAPVSGWQHAARADATTTDRWQESTLLNAVVESGWQHPPLLTQSLQSRWHVGVVVTAAVLDRFGDGRRIDVGIIEWWQPAGYPANKGRSGPTIPAVNTPATRLVLNIICPLPGSVLNIGRTQCPLIPISAIPVRRSYMSLNSASLVRWPDLTPLPATSMTIQTDAGSWCWALTAALFGTDAYDLVKPNPLACEVLATINGFPWKFLLDVPSREREFGSDSVTLKGRSRSAWLHSPYLRVASGVNASAREMHQLGDEALDNTGWTLSWGTQNWVVPAQRYAYSTTPIGQLLALLAATDDGLYSDPVEQIIYTRRKWPVASWLVDGLPAEIQIPIDMVIHLTESPTYTTPINGVYVSGTTAGVQGLVKIAGTDGALQPAEPIVHELLCDTAGVAIGQRGLNALSDAGAGFDVEAETLLTTETGLIIPWKTVDIAGVKGVSRSVSIKAEWGNDGLRVTQSVGFERREVEA